LWEFTVIEGLDSVPGLPRGSYGIVSKIHHACIDGVSGVDITEAIHSLEPYPALPPAPDKPWKGEEDPNPMELMAKAQYNNMTQPFRFAEVMAHAIPAIARFQEGIAARKFEVNAAVPKTRFSGRVTAHRVLEGRNFELAEVREIKRHVEKATVNDVILTICGGALRKYLHTKKDLPNDSLVAMAPISVRPADGKKALGNQVAAMTVKIGTNIEDPLERLKAVHEAAAASKEMTNAIGAKLMTDFNQFIPSTTAALSARLYTDLGLSDRSPSPFNCVITNVPGPQFPLYSAGAKLVTQFGLGPIFDGMGLIFPVFSYNGQITITVNSCREMMPDPDFFAKCLQESYDELKAATIG
jgi:WS/DGAT/MGAT family acyltransferase